MSYEVILLPRAEVDFANLETHLQAFVETRFSELGQSPTQLSRRAVSPPYPPGFQIYEFDFDVPGEDRHHFAVLFRYGQDEASLHVAAIGHTHFRDY